MSSRSLKLYHLLVLSWLLGGLGCAAGKAGRPETIPAGHLHHYGVEPGEVIRYQNKTVSHMDVAMPVARSFEFEIGSTLRLQTETSDRYGIRGVIVIEEAYLEGEMAQVYTSFPISVSDLEGSRFAISVNRRGKVEEIRALDAGPDRGGLINLASVMSGIFIPWPDRPLLPGDSWVDSTKTGHVQQGIDVTTTLVSTYTYMGLQNEDLGAESAEVQTVRRVSTTRTSGTGHVEGMMVTFSASGSGEATFFYDARDGILISARYSEELSMQSEISGAVNMSVPTDVHVITTTRRIR